MHLPALVTMVVLGLLVLLSYLWVFLVLEPGNYFSHPYWLDLPRAIIGILVAFQLLAVVGFITAVTSWVITPPQGGLVGSSSFALPLILAVFLIFSLTWAPAVFYKKRWLVVLSLVGTAMASIVLLVGSVEEDKPRWWIVCGFLLLCHVTVLTDAILWNAKYISRAKMDPCKVH